MVRHILMLCEGKILIYVGAYILFRLPLGIAYSEEPQRKHRTFASLLLYDW
jgi:hypothetical protein